MDSRGAMKSSAMKMASVIDLKTAEICNVWFADLMEKWHKKSDQKLRTLKKHRKEKKDLLSLLVKSLLKRPAIGKREVDSLLHRVRTQEYSIFDFFVEISSLEESIESVLRASSEIRQSELSDAMKVVHGRLSEVFAQVLKETSEIYEYIAESEGRGFCQVDRNRYITFANAEMKRLLRTGSVMGKQLDSYFKGEEKKFVREALSGKRGERPQVRALELVTAGGRSTPVMVESAPIIMGGQKTGGYACMTDLSRQVKAEREIFDKSFLGIAKVNLKGQITYLNRRAMEVLGMQQWEEITLRDIFHEKNYKKVLSHLKRRKRGLTSEYEVEITRLDDKRQIPVMVSGNPDIDLRGNIIGSVAVVRTMELEKAVEAMHRHIETSRDTEELLTAVAKETQNMIPFDYFGAGLYTADMRQARPLFNYLPSGQLQVQRRWWQISVQGRQFLRRKKTVVGNLHDFLSQERWKHLGDDRQFKKILEAGFNAFIYCPVVRENKLVGCINLYSRRENAFDKNHANLVEMLPLRKALLTALHYEEKEDLAFRLNLMKKISSASNNIKKMADVLVNEIARHYDWQDVTLFGVDEEHDEISLLSHKATSEEFQRSPDHTQKTHEGILGEVYRKNVSVNIGNVRTDPKYSKIYKAVLPSAVSELCLPISIEGKVRWLLNIEDPQENAFSEQERKTLEGVLEELGALLQRAWLYHVLNRAVWSASDAVIFTDVNGNISQMNPAARRLLACSQKEMKGSLITDVFVDADVAERVLEIEKVPGYKVAWRRRNGEEISVFLSAFRLSQGLGGRVFIAKDLRLPEHMEKLKYLQKMYYELATQTKTPLSLVFTWLGRLRQEPKTDVDTIDRVLQQLGKVELTFDRLALYDEEQGVARARPFLLSIKEVVDRVLEDIPKKDRDMIILDPEEPPPLLLRGDFFQLVFCFQSILSYLLRFLPEEDTIHWEIRRENDTVVSEISSYFPGSATERPEDVHEAYSVSRAWADMAMGKKFIKNFIKNNNGTFFDPRVEDETMTFRIELRIPEGY